MKILCIGDIHAGSRWAPWPADYVLNDGSMHKCSPEQLYLNDCWQHLLDDARRRRPDIIILNGDLIDGGHTRNVDVVTTKNDEQIGVAAMLLAPLIKTARQKVYATWGTGFHTGRCGENERTLCKEVLDIPHLPEIYLQTQAKVLHATHHVSSSSNPMYEATPLLRALLVKKLELMRAYGKDDMPDVRCIVRSHRHRTMVIETEDNCLVVALSSWMLKNEHVYRVAPENESQIGYAWITADEKGYHGERVRFRLPLPEVIRLG